MKYLVVLLALSIGLTTRAQLISDSLMAGGYYRSFHYNDPHGQRSGGSLLFIMHGSGGSGKQIMQRTAAIEAMAAKENLLIVYPDAYQHYWNECRKFSTAFANTANIDEQAFFRSMIAYFHSRFGIDTTKVFAAGFSGGGHMAYKLGLTMPGTISAIAAIVANMPDSASCDCTEARKALPVLIINGTLDQTNPYNGGEMFVNNASFGVVRSSRESHLYWAKLAGYNGHPAHAELPNTDTTDQRTIESYTYKKKGKPEVQLLKVVGGKHDYPGDINVWVYAWDFFKRQYVNKR
ncbi:MAG TPA: PHB depolymerase family esterase [Chitinophagaceae bacterium]|jgi:polyhydroxybutyrate depolymerase|nr:PHB depolymerase family esterase [Chitinophagaceae bacterium]